MNHNFLRGFIRKTRTMRFVLIFLVFFLQNEINCYDSESSEINHIEITPYYDTIIFSDVIDIINELNRNTHFNAFANSDSESDENVEDLLSEYQHYLDKAHEQRRIYLEKTNKTKNKVPLMRHDAFVKKNYPQSFEKYNNDYYSTNNYYNQGIFKLPPTAFRSPLDLFIPMNPQFPYNLNKPEREKVNSVKVPEGELPNFEKTAGAKKTLSLSSLQTPVITNEPLKSPCVCSPATIPCKCNCKQCVIPLNLMTPRTMLPNSELNTRTISQTPLFVDPRIQDHLLEDANNNENTVNVRIKVDIQLPKILNPKLFSRDSALEYEDTSKEVRIPTTSFNFPIPIDLFGNKRSQKINRHDSSPFRRITIHKKKKSRTNFNNNKKHRKKLITFHNVKLAASQSLKPLVQEHLNSSIGNRTVEKSNKTFPINATTKANLVASQTEKPDSTTLNPDATNNTNYVEGIYFMVNISHNNENYPEDAPKTGNSIELDFKSKSNTSNIRRKRDLHMKPTNNVTDNTKILNAATIPNQSKSKGQKLDDTIRKSADKGWVSDSELLYWPNTANKNISVGKPTNITDIIFEREHKKAKLNISKETIRHNHTKALEQAIFGQVDWNDMDAVAPTFISFVGKYINGVITFCSQNICHSMKCAKKTCFHRTCNPDERFNHLGHCSGSSKTDSVASMESIMDLPSNVAFEIVDILQDKMLGKLHGKVTLCISMKCITFAASKKKFIKYKCTSKNLDETGHCLSIKKS